MRQHDAELEALDIQVAVVTFQNDLFAKAYVRDAGCSWPILIDESRALYKAYGMERAGWWDLLGPASWWAYIRLLLRGRRLFRPAGDVSQLGGDVLIDPTGIVRLHHNSSGPADRPAVASLLAIVRDNTRAVTSLH